LQSSDSQPRGETEEIDAQRRQTVQLPLQQQQQPQEQQLLQPLLPPQQQLPSQQQEPLPSLEPLQQQEQQVSQEQEQQPRAAAAAAAVAEVFEDPVVTLDASSGRLTVEPCIKLEWPTELEVAAAQLVKEEAAPPPAPSLKVDDATSWSPLVNERPLVSDAKVADAREDDICQFLADTVSGRLMSSTPSTSASSKPQTLDLCKETTQSLSSTPLVATTPPSSTEQGATSTGEVQVASETIAAAAAAQGSAEEEADSRRESVTLSDRGRAEKRSSSAPQGACFRRRVPVAGKSDSVGPPLATAQPPQRRPASSERFRSRQSKSGATAAAATTPRQTAAIPPPQQQQQQQQLQRKRPPSAESFRSRRQTAGLTTSSSYKGPAEGAVPRQASSEQVVRASSTESFRRRTPRPGGVRPPAPAEVASAKPTAATNKDEALEALVKPPSSPRGLGRRSRSGPVGLASPVRSSLLPPAAAASSTARVPSLSPQRNTSGGSLNARDIEATATWQEYAAVFQAESLACSTQRERQIAKSRPQAEVQARQAVLEANWNKRWTGDPSRPRSALRGTGLRTQSSSNSQSHSHSHSHTHQPTHTHSYHGGIRPGWKRTQW